MRPVERPGEDWNYVCGTQEQADDQLRAVERPGEDWNMGVPGGYIMYD